MVYSSVWNGVCYGRVDRGKEGRGYARCCKRQVVRLAGDVVHDAGEHCRALKCVPCDICRVLAIVSHRCCLVKTDVEVEYSCTVQLLQSHDPIFSPG